MKHDILIADDDEHLREMLELMFSDKFNIHFAETGQQTIDAILKYISAYHSRYSFTSESLD